MIQYTPRHKTRNEEIIARLRAEVGAGVPIDPRKKLKRLVAEASILMALIHGGDWRAQVDHDLRLIVIRPD